MPLSFIKGSPALLIEKPRTVVVSDLHIGKEFKLARAGMHFPDASKRMAEQLLEICGKERSRSIIMLGDIKESIGYPPRDELDAIASFFHPLRQMNITIVKGNHDARIGEILRRIGIGISPVNELLVGRIAMIHGNAMPSERAMSKDYLLAGHSHIAIDVNGAAEKGWLVARVGPRAAESYERYNKRARLVVLPAFNSLITGVRVGAGREWSMPLLRNGVFDPTSAKAYDLDGNIVETSSQ